MQREPQTLADITVALPLPQTNAMELPSRPAFEMQPDLWESNHPNLPAPPDSAKHVQVGASFPKRYSKTCQTKTSKQLD